MIGSLKRNTQLGELAQNRVEEAVSKWLTGSRDRDGKITDAKKEKAQKRRLEYQSGDEQDSEIGSSSRRVQQVGVKIYEAQKRNEKENVQKRRQEYQSEEDEQEVSEVKNRKREYSSDEHGVESD